MREKDLFKHTHQRNIKGKHSLEHNENQMLPVQLREV